MVESTVTTGRTDSAAVSEGVVQEMAEEETTDMVEHGAEPMRTVVTPEGEK